MVGCRAERRRREERWAASTSLPSHSWKRRIQHVGLVRGRARVFAQGGQIAAPGGDRSSASIGGELPNSDQTGAPHLLVSGVDLNLPFNMDERGGPGQGRGAAAAAGKGAFCDRVRASALLAMAVGAPLDRLWEAFERVRGPNRREPFRRVLRVWTHPSLASAALFFFRAHAHTTGRYHHPKTRLMTGKLLILLPKPRTDIHYIVPPPQSTATPHGAPSPPPAAAARAPPAPRRAALRPRLPPAGGPRAH